MLRRHEKALCKGEFAIEPADRLFNPARETARVLAKAERIGAHTAALARELFARLGRPGQRAIYGLADLARHYPYADIEAVCARLIETQIFSYAAVKRAGAPRRARRRERSGRRSGADRLAHPLARRVPNVLGESLPDSTPGGSRWQCLSLNWNDRDARFACPAWAQPSSPRTAAWMTGRS
ncbi:MAG: hypothetical protein IT495_18890 [Gammaproteobacteria bacterium]|nr:hypothetical protein [Gammaproteobacteria bacterium]